MERIARVAVGGDLQTLPAMYGGDDGGPRPAASEGGELRLARRALDKPALQEVRGPDHGPVANRCRLSLSSMPIRGTTVQ